MTTRYLTNMELTSANDGQRIILNAGKPIHGPVRFGLYNGTTIAALLQRKTPNGTWKTIIDPDDHGTLDAEDEFIVNGGGEFSVNITTVTGTWNMELVQLIQ